MYLWNLEKDSLGYFDFEKGLNDNDEVCLAGLDANDPDTHTTYEK